MRIHHAFLAGILLATALPAFAQTEVGILAHGVISSQPNQSIGVFACVLPHCPTTQVDSGFSIGGFIAHSVGNFRVASLSLELPVFAISSRGTNLPAVSFSTFAVTPGVRVNFLPQSSISPFLSAGGGIVHFSGDTPSVTKGAVVFGGGVDFKTGVPHFGVRAEVKDMLAPSPSPLIQTGVNNILVGGGVVFKF